MPQSCKFAVLALPYSVQLRAAANDIMDMFKTCNGLHVRVQASDACRLLRITCACESATSNGNKQHAVQRPAGANQHKDDAPAVMTSRELWLIIDVRRCRQDADLA